MLAIRSTHDNLRRCSFDRILGLCAGKYRLLFIGERPASTTAERLQPNQLAIDSSTHNVADYQQVDNSETDRKATLDYQHLENDTRVQLLPLSQNYESLNVEVADYINLPGTE